MYRHDELKRFFLRYPSHNVAHRLRSFWYGGYGERLPYRRELRGSGFMSIYRIVPTASPRAAGGIQDTSSRVIPHLIYPWFAVLGHRHFFVVIIIKGTAGISGGYDGRVAVIFDVFFFSGD